MPPPVSTSSADRLLAVLQLFTPERPQWTVETAAAEIGVSVSTAYRYFRSLCRIGLLDPYTGGSYVLGPAIIEFDRQIRIGDPLIKVAGPVMRRLVAQAGHLGMALLCRVYRNRVMCVHQESEGRSDLAVGFERGRPMPMFRGASSKIIFAHLSSRQARWFVLKYPDQVAASGLGAGWEAIKTSLRRIRAAGICITRSEVDRDRVGIAAPVFDASGKVLGSVGLAVAQTDATHQFVANAAALVAAAGSEIDQGLREAGGQATDVGVRREVRTRAPSF
jgi:DNA-binding IclR family transcriptional regulator